MERPPRDSKEPILAQRHWIAIAVYGVIIAGAVLAVFAIALNTLGMEQNQAVTVSFMTLAFARLWHVFNMRDYDSRLIQNEVTRNLYVWGALVLSTGILLSAVYLPILSDVFQTVHPGLNGWGLIIGMSFVPLIVGQIWKLWQSRRLKKRS